ncbi:MAG: hydrogenase expression/formation protein HypE [Acidobacteria bacterium]|nr:hydrogenase expression/formation protein HypE [Acidobacteriota bacterium]
MSSDRAPVVSPEPLAVCPLPIGQYDRVLLGHGSGGRLTADLVRQVFLPAFDNVVLSRLEDQAVCALDGARGPRVAFTTDSYVVRPIFFPGGDIGRLAIHGTVNDLAVGGATPLFISAAFILEEGLPIADLQRVAASMRAACDEAGVTLVTGDTKVVDRGKGDQIYVTTSGIGLVPAGCALSASSAKPGDRVVLSGTIGDHGMAIMSVREGLEFETTLESDTAALGGLTRAMLAASDAVRCMRALYVANEGKLVAIVAPGACDAVIEAMRAHPLGRDAAVIGEIVAQHPGMVVMKSLVGGARVVSMLAGEQLPRIC